MQLAAAWERYQSMVISAGAPAVQITESKRCFYAGSHALLQIIMGFLEETVDDEPTNTELGKMDRLHQEIRDFQKDVAQGRA